ncbi:MAG: HEAT repeat domain-containing protein [Candidatus Sumerlaeota bacterium]|nr:HEAT repeat domain-containing protein [Candidatus Sumerlaeota bacterium]
MRRIPAILFTAIFSLAVHAQSQPIGFEGAQWIWEWPDPGQATPTPDAGACYFRVVMTLPENSQIKTAEAFIAADNLFALYLNGQFVGKRGSNPNAWNQPSRYDVAGLLAPGRNVIAVEAVNTAPGPAGLIMKLIATLSDGRQVALVTDDNWKCSSKEEKNWQLPGFDDKGWGKAFIVGEYGAAPWGKFARDLSKIQIEKANPSANSSLNWQAPVEQETIRPSSIVEVTTPPADFQWPEGIVFLGDDCSLYRGKKGGTSHDSLGVTMFTARKSRSYPEHDLPAPIKIGRKLFALKPARPDAKPRLMLDAGKGAIGTPHVSFDGRWIYMSMARDGEPFFHIYKMSAEGGEPQRLTDGPFHDIDPAEAPDGRIIFTSTRIGTFEEYHCPPSRALFAMDADGKDIHPLTHTFIFDNEPAMLADGRILFIRTDNFFDRGKVETLLHAVHPDGTEGYTEFGLDNGPEYGGRLRAFYCGSPAPMPDGRVAFVSAPGITVGRPGSAAKDMRNFSIQAGDVAALLDGRLICTLARLAPDQAIVKKNQRVAMDLSYEKIGIFDPDGKQISVTILHDATGAPLHSPSFLGARPRPPILAKKVDRTKEDDVHATGFLFCQNARFTKNTAAGWPNVRAIRVLMGKGLTMRSSHAYIVHAGNDVTELGTVPLAPDGSFSIEVPADRAISFQAVDAEGRSELNEMSWIYVRPGESRGCIGCHQPRQTAPPRAGTQLAQAFRVPPLRLLGQGQPHRFRGNNAAVTGLMEMQFDRYREMDGLNRHSETADPLATGAQEVSALCAQLKGADSGLKISAAQRLAIFRDRAAAAALAERLGDEDREARVAAAMALAACGTRESMKPLLAALDDADPLAAQAAAVAMENLTGHSEEFNAFAESEQHLKEAEKWRAWFRQTNWDAIEQDLVRRMESADRDVVRRAAVALGHIGGEAARAALRKYVTRERENNPYPEWGKTHRGDGAKFNAASPANPRTLQAATRSLGYLKDATAIPMLAEAIGRNSDPETANLFLTEAAVEALGRIGTPDAEEALIKALTGLKDYFYYVGWYGDHSALYACHSSPAHYLIAEALDSMGAKRAGAILPHLIRSVPTDPDRALMPGNDDCEALVGRVIRRSGAEAMVTETCLSLLGDQQTSRTKEIADAISKTYAAWAGKPDPENRAAQILSLVCRDRKYEPRIRAALDRYRAKPAENFVRAFAGGGLPRSLPVKNWVCFFLARELGNLRDPQSVDSLIAVLEQCPKEAAKGYPDPCEPGVLFLHNELTPCYRAAAAWALGRIGDRRAAPVLLKVIGDLDNAPDTRYAAAEALGCIADPASADAIRKLAANYPDITTRKALLRACQGSGGDLRDLRDERDAKRLD